MRCTWEYQKLKWQNYQFWGIPIPYNITLTGPNTITNLQHSLAKFVSCHNCKLTAAVLFTILCL